MGGETSPSGYFAVGIPGRVVIEHDDEAGAVTDNLALVFRDQLSFGKHFHLHLVVALGRQQPGGPVFVSSLGHVDDAGNVDWSGGSDRNRFFSHEECVQEMIWKEHASCKSSGSFRRMVSDRGLS
ncbi:MAG: hypothetical protein BWY82_00218 [Verrucomicrobia bacterium ADurb.Bin474]|nr:MAG: hypothetical protein BWY82_00218 [Verrucomicrobia bacterium ADurb.Bin474]